MCLGFTCLRISFGARLPRPLKENSRSLALKCGGFMCPRRATTSVWMRHDWLTAVDISMLSMLSPYLYPLTTDSNILILQRE